MNLSASSPHLTDYSSSKKFILPSADSLERTSSLIQDHGLSDSGIVKDKLDAKCSIASGGYWTPRETLKKQKELTTSSQDYNDIEMKTQSLVNKGSSASHIQLTSGEKKTRYSLPDKDWKDFNLDYLDVAKLQLKRMSEDLNRQFIDSITASTEYGFDKIIKKLFCFDCLPDIFSSKSMF